MADYPENLLDQIKALEKRIQDLESPAYARHIHVGPGHIFHANGADGTVGFFDHVVTGPQPTPITLADVVTVLRAWGIVR